METASLAQRLQARGIRLDTSIGQHFLIDKEVLEHITSHSALGDNSIVVEVGCGAGVLTQALLETGAVVHGFEIDPRFVSLLKIEFHRQIANGKFVLHEGDALRTLPEVLKQLPQYCVVANVPYQITTPLLERFLEPDHFGGYVLPNSLTVLVQRELGERITAKAGDSERGFLSVLLELQTESAITLHVPPAAFLPPPAVDSVVVHAVPRAYVPDIAFHSFIRGGFQQRRKQLKNVLAGMRGVAVSVATGWLEAAHLSLTCRAQELRVTDWQRLYEAAKKVQ